MRPAPKQSGVTTTAYHLDVETSQLRHLEWSCTLDRDRGTMSREDVIAFILTIFAGGTYMAPVLHRVLAHRDALLRSHSLYANLDIG